MKLFPSSALSLAVALSAAGTIQLAQAQAQSVEEELEEVVVTGSRRAPRSVFDSAVPIDVVGGDDFANQGDSDLSNLLRNVVPSYNVNAQPISDAATIVRPANMRGLAPDHTLVLVNGKRRHRAAVIYWLGNGVADGAQGADISPIPAIALKQVEVLRDGAAAQYGSDAIAGVMNFILKDDPEGGSIEVKYGEYKEGDGENVMVAGNVGMPFTDNGFVNVSFEYGNTDPTDRSQQRSDAQALIDAGNTAVANPAQIWGTPEIKGDLKLMANLGLELGGGKEFFAFANYATKEVEGGFFFRNPDTRGGVFSNDGGVTRLVADLTPDDGVACPTVDVGDAAALQQVVDDPNCFVFNEMFPGGFTPRFGGKVHDAALTAGVRGTTASDLNWELSASYGRNDVDFFIKNTVNASLGPLTPTAFDPGDYTQQDINFNADVSYAVPVDAFESDLNIAAGVEWREETFEITVGDQASFEIGPYASQGFSAASNGFPGFSPLAGGSFARKNVAAYVDLEADVTDRLLVGMAIRWEDFSDFGTTTNGKISANFEITENFSLRGSASTGFRAPTPGQSNAFNVSTEFDAATGDLVNNGTIPSTNPVAVLRGGKPLDPEESESYTLGAILQLGEVSVTIDYFNIELTDRISVSQNFSLTQQEIDDLVASGVTSAQNLQNFRFFTNDFDTTTSGFDLVATYGLDMLGGSSEFSLAYNYTETEVDSFSPDVIDATRIRELQEGLPESRWNLAMTHNLEDWRFLLRMSYFNEFYDSEDDRSYGDEYIFDAEAEYNINDNYSVTLGAQNLLDEYPDENPSGAQQSGRRYSQFSPTGFNGGYYYARVRYSF
ncbi:TonB-dependent receptor [uncultured Pseudoteredinibacter sp.]|uniref:TonB-dependent receptor plug domain-containing protein n=1 Tax=uncultured Pseudoteredinibacter sp. TaxID=1641701 RepID=UPI0026271D71|nr:TonB-dependent receptor [uncultured Pseudoteredinibacter sp.]